MVYVLDRDGKPLMPTKRHGKVKHLLRAKKAKVVKRCPFTIRLLYESTGYTQPVTLGVDTGSKHIGLSATTEEDELYAAEVELRTDITDLLASRRQYRRERRNRLRYRKARFNNRKGQKYAPSVQNKINTHLKAVADVHKILPITKIIVETASFDIQKIKNPDISGAEYQQGELANFWNVREYVMFRDGHTCQCCKGKSKDKILNVHHIESRKTGGDAPNNLITLCETCHTGYHKGTVTLPKSVCRGMSFRDASFMGIMRWAFYEKLKELYPDVSMTYGYITKNVRIANGLEKTHCVDARCISGHPLAKPVSEYYYCKKVRCHNRQIHKANFIKGHRKKWNQAEHIVHGYRLFDRVKYDGREYFIFGRRSSGYFDIRTLSGEKVNKGSVSCKKLTLTETRKSLLTERRKLIPPPPVEVGVS